MSQTLRLIKPHVLLKAEWRPQIPMPPALSDVRWDSNLQLSHVGDEQNDSIESDQRMGKTEAARGLSFTSFQTSCDIPFPTFCDINHFKTASETINIKTSDMHIKM